jgi:3-phenylpropionate/trans-cinnamate dioxygenase ferredoxin subunit
MSPGTRVAACPMSELAPGGRRVVAVPELELLVLNCGGQLFAIENRCSHEDAALTDGPLDESDWSIECPRHGSRFDLRTGRPLNLPAYRPIEVFDTELVDGMVTVQID